VYLLRTLGDTFVTYTKDLWDVIVIIYIVTTEGNGFIILGLLREAAEMKSDESILRHIRDKDCVAIEVKYHRTCYRNYTRFLSKTESSKEERYVKEHFVIRNILANGWHFLAYRSIAMPLEKSSQSMFVSLSFSSYFVFCNFSICYFS